MPSLARTIVITGVTRGLGRALVDHFIPAGHRVFGCGRSKQHIAQLRDTFGERGHFTALDVTDEPEVQAWAAEVERMAGPADLLINNAAVMNQPAPLWEVPSQEVSRLIDINIKGIVYVIRAFVPAMVQRKQGVIVNLSSGWGRSTSPEVAPYCASKYAVEGLTLALAQELPRGMAAIPLNPGVIDTDMLRECWGKDAGRYPSAAEWAKRAAPFLLNLGARHNGQSLTV